MKELEVVLFQLEFKRYLIQLQGLVLLALCIFWVVNSRKAISQYLENRSPAGAAWLGISVLSGAYFAVSAALEWGWQYLLAATALGTAIALAMLVPAVSVCLISAMLFLRPWELIGNDDYFSILPKLLTYICAAQCILVMAREKRLVPIWSTSSLFLVLFSAWAFVTTFRAASPTESQRVFFEVYLKNVIIYFLVLNSLRTREDLRLFSRTILMTFLAVGLISIWQTALLPELPSQHEIRLRGIGAFSNANDIAALMVWILPFAWAEVINKASYFAWRAAAGVMAVLVAVAVQLSQSRGAVLAIAISIGLYVALKTRKRAVIAAYAVAAALAVPAMVSLSNRQASDLEGSSSSRIIYLKAGLYMAAKNPVFGVGFDAYPINYESYAPGGITEWGRRTAHNSWILVMAETGFPGIILYVAFFVFAAIQAYGLFSTNPELIIAMVGYGTAITFLSHSYLLYPYLLCAIIGAWHAVYRRELESPPETLTI